MAELKIRNIRDKRQGFDKYPSRERDFIPYFDPVLGLLLYLYPLVFIRFSAVFSGCLEDDVGDPGNLAFLRI